MQDAIRSYYKLKLECYGVYTTVFHITPYFLELRISTSKLLYLPRYNGDIVV
jgi:hypothetical protein